VSSNLDAYDLIVCFGDDSPDAPQFRNQSCKLAPSVGSLFSQINGGATSSKSIVSYVESLIVYAGFGVACALICIVCACCFCQFRCCCCCVRGGSCGKRYPTFALKRCSLGFNEVEISLLSSSANAAELGYPLRARWGVRLCMFVYIITALSFVMVGQLRGNLAITTSMQVRATGASPRPRTHFYPGDTFCLRC
jgi:hypothetical protein